MKITVGVLSVLLTGLVVFVVFRINTAYKKAEPNKTGIVGFAQPAELKGIGEKTPDFKMRAIDGENLCLRRDYIGKVTLIDFWATWCVPCKRDLPELKAAYKKYHSNGFDIISVSLDRDEAKVRDFLEKNQIPWRVIRVENEAESPLCKKYGVKGLPDYFMLDRQGILRATRPTLMSEEGVILQEKVAKLLGTGFEASGQVLPEGWVGGRISAKHLGNKCNVALIRADGDTVLWSMQNEYTDVDEDGNYAFFHVPPGKYWFCVRYGGMSGNSVLTRLLRPVEVGAFGRPNWINLEYEGGSGSLKVKCPGFYSITIWSHEDKVKGWVERAKYLDNRVEYLDGYEFKNLPPGRYGMAAVRQVGGNILVQRAEIDLQESEHASCYLQPKQGSACLEGQINGYKGDVSDLRVLVRTPDSGPIEFATIYGACTRDAAAVIYDIQEGGSYRCSGLPSGRYTITAAQFPPQLGQERRPIQQLSRIVEIREGQTTRVDFNLSPNAESSPTDSARNTHKSDMQVEGEGH